MSFRAIVFAVVIGAILSVAAFGLHELRPRSDVQRPDAASIRATGKCAECHSHETPAIIHQYATSEHAARNITCLDCHRPAPGQSTWAHRGFELTRRLTSANCRTCHETQYQQFVRSRHAAPSWAAVRGAEDFTAEQIAEAEALHPGAVRRPASPLVGLQGEAAARVGCEGCHQIGRPQPDGSIGRCTECHARHAASIELARLPQTCGQCHMGPDHSQIEIYNASKHGVLFHAQRDRMNLAAEPAELTTEDMFTPTCATCHMSGLDGLASTHDTTERLSYFLFAAVSDERPGFEAGQAAMKDVCARCHARSSVEQFYAEATEVLEDTNEKVLKAREMVEELRARGELTPAPFDDMIEFVYFDLWHYYGRTAKHGAFMGGADFVQWHGNYELLHKGRELEEMAEALLADEEAPAHDEGAPTPAPVEGEGEGEP